MERCFYFLLKFLNREGKKNEGSRVINNEMGELDRDKEEIKLKQRRRGKHSFLAVEIFERARAGQDALEVIAGAKGSSDTQTAFFSLWWECWRGAVKDCNRATGHRWAVKWVKNLNAIVVQCHQSVKNGSSLLGFVVVIVAEWSFHSLRLWNVINVKYLNPLQTETKSITLIIFISLAFCFRTFSAKLFASFSGYQRRYNIWQLHSVFICSWRSVTSWHIHNASSWNRSDFYALYHI